MLPCPDSEKMSSAREATLFTFTPAAANSKLKKGGIFDEEDAAWIVRLRGYWTMTGIWMLVMLPRESMATTVRLAEYWTSAIAGVPEFEGAKFVSPL